MEAIVNECRAPLLLVEEDEEDHLSISQALTGNKKRETNSEKDISDLERKWLTRMIVIEVVEALDSLEITRMM
ncbi:hypothetical protein E3N88_34745 [Mikania micrantha]|uniref:Uncharacterized protein n=1 Tax=Mikania micrantha TaxID=192012 RepID=A0A5N6LZ15_9ASTR|nr:hypothetical protein E3N88_34745 [Mikania micrantha]